MPYGYTSRRHEDETDLMYFRARYYDTNTGEFISRDPLEYVDGMSQYRGYFILNSADPSGLARKTFGLVAKSFINGVKPIGSIIPDRPGIPIPNFSTVISPGHWTATRRLHFFAGLVSRLPAFNQNPVISAKDGIYRLYTKVNATVDCCDDKPVLINLTQDMDGGVESDPPIGYPNPNDYLPDWFPKPVVKGTINLSPLNVTYPDPTTLNIDWRGWGRPNRIAEPGMQWVATRTSFNIWHWPDVYIRCNNGNPYVSASLFAGGSNFPSHRLWINGRRVAFKGQGKLSDLWVPHPTWKWFVK